MKQLIRHSPLGVIGILVMLSLTTAAVYGQKTNKRMEDAQRHSQAAAKVFNEIMGVRDKAIPKELLDKAEAIAVFPGVVKAAFIFGGHGGQGVISRRTKNGWDAPAFFNLSGGSFGAQIGAQKTDYVLLIMNEEGLKGLLEDKFEMGGEASVAAGPVGRTAAATTNTTLDAGILSYSRTQGAFIGASLKGAVMSPDNDLNEAVYDGKKASVVLSSGSGMQMKNMPAGVRILPQTLARYSSRRGK